MKISKQRLKQIIKEELKKVLMSEGAEPTPWSYGSSLDPNELRRMADQMEAIPPEAFGDFTQEILSAEQERFVGLLAPGLDNFGPEIESLMKQKLDMMDQEEYEVFQEKMADELLKQHRPWTPRTSKKYLNPYVRSASIAVELLGLQS